MFWKALCDGRCFAVSTAILASQIQNRHEEYDENQEFKYSKSKIALDPVVKKCRNLVRKKMSEIGAPGMVVGVAVNGKTVWSQGFGYSDIENSVPCTSDTVMRIASISKSLTMAAVAKLVEDGKLDLDKSVHEYVPEFPKKYYDNKKVDITTRMLLSHTSGVRHYSKVKPSDQITEDFEKPSEETQKAKSEFDQKEYHSMKEYANVIESLQMFKNDELFSPPGEKFLYTSHGWTLISAVVERAASEDFVLHMEKMFHLFGMSSTVPENAKNIIYKRARQYTRNGKGYLVNSPYVNNSYKWAGGGFLSNIPDLLIFGNIMLYSSQFSDKSQVFSGEHPGFLKQSTVKQMWSTVSKPEVVKDETYGMGWFVYPEKGEFGCAKKRHFAVGHTGGAIGGSSILYILPLDISSNINCLSSSSNNMDTDEFSKQHMLPPTGIVIVILTNLQSVNLTELAKQISNEFLPFT